jgi:hypothetical protein
LTWQSLGFSPGPARSLTANNRKAAATPQGDAIAHEASL